MPVIYARRSWQLVRQIGADTFVLLWAVAWGMAALVVHAGVAALAAPAAQSADALRQVSADFGAAAERASTVPGLGEQLRQPFDSSVARLGDVIAAADRQVAAIGRLADLAGWLTFLLPVLLVVAAWLPVRVRFARRARAAQQFLDSAADVDLFAMRALTNQPFHVLARISDDPVAAWRAGDRRVVDALADLELRRSGLRLHLDGPVSSARTTGGRAGTGG